MTEGTLDKHVLLIDFDPVAAELTGALLATRGLPFVLARNHAELDRALAGGPPALVVIDPARPDESEGLRICASLSERLGSTGKVPIILASRSLRGPRWKTLARDAGAELFLERPKDDRLLLAAAERALAQAAAAPAPPSAPTAAPATPRATAPRGPAVVTTASALRPPPPAENELENMVDQMFAQWFAEGEGPDSTASGPLSVPPPPRSAAPALSGPSPVPAAAATAAPRTTGVGAAVLEPPPPSAPEVSRTRSASMTSAAATASPAEPVVVPLPAAPAAPRPVPAASVPIAAPASGAFAPAKTSRPAAAPPAPAAAAAPTPPTIPTPFAALPGRETASVSPLKRPLAIAAAVVLIAVGAGALYLQRSGSAGGDTEAVEVASRRPSRPLPAESADSPESSAKGVETPASSTGAVAPPVAERPAPKTPPVAAATAAPNAAPAAGSRPEPQREAQTVAARPAATTAPASIAPPVAAPAAPITAKPATPPPPTTTPAAEAGASNETAAPAVSAPQTESEFIPDIVPDGTLPAADPSSDATLARYTAPQLIPSTRVNPAFPPGARQMRMTGQVKLQVKVRPDGSVGAVTVLSEPKPAVGFGKAAETAVRQWRYRPAMMGSRAVDSEIVVVVNFAGE